MNGDSSKRTYVNLWRLLGSVGLCVTPGVLASIHWRDPHGAIEYVHLGLYGLAALNVVVTLAIAVDRGLLVRQKIGQALIVWLIPFLGGLFIGIFMWTQRGSAPATGYLGDTNDGPRNVYLGTHPPGPPGGC